MYLKVSGKVLLGIAVALSIYLSITAIWASLIVSDVLPEVTKSNKQSLLTIEQEKILLKIEDPTFYEHAGLDISEGQGLTTITSSVARNVFLFGENLSGAAGSFQSLYRGVFKCCKRIDLGRDIMALVLNQNLSKEQQLQLFVSSSYMGGYKGRQIKGFPAAASSYFKKSLSDITEDEFITLVAMLKAPNYFHPTKGAKQLKTRVSSIKKILAGTCKPRGWLDTEYKYCAGNA